MATRNTFQRQKILEYLSSVKTHPTAEMVYTKVLKNIPTITLATVYRNLNLLAKQGIILRLEVNKEYHYDACIEEHQHGICGKCGKIMDFMDEELSQYTITHLKQKDFKPSTVNIIFQGTCESCNEVH